MSMIIDTTQGVWSEISLLKVDTKDHGYFVIQVTEAKHQSNLSKRGETCLLVQVNLLPNRFNSSTLRLLIAALKQEYLAHFIQAYSYQRPSNHVEISQEKPVCVFRHLNVIDPV
jgi:hypothetical protein